jgi:3-hydroxyacyl-CoA dehydrogenase/enoyl-CoA hydratase/3-hydroxybutyryl-CoA epimerase
VTPAYASLEDASFVIESVPEDLAVKQEVLAAVEVHAAAGCIFASNTSSIPLTAIAARAARQGQVVGTHFFWPAHRYRLVEIASAVPTGEPPLRRTLDVVRWMGKVPLLVRDRPGFFTTRVLLVYLNEAVALVRAGAAVDEVDRAMRRFGWAMGPFQLLDAVGLGIFRAIHQWVSPCVADRVADFAHLWPVLRAGHAGFANGHRDGAKGFYRNPAAGEVDERVYSLIGRNGHPGPAPEEISVRPIRRLLNEVELCLAEGVVSSIDDAELGLRLGLGWPSAQGSPLAYAHRMSVPGIARQ